MVKVDTIFIRLKTKDVENAGTDGDVYLGIGGREFQINKSDRDDFERGDDATYILGDRPITPPENGIDISSWANNPKDPYIIKTENLNMFPVYIRLENADSVSSVWHLDYVEVRVNPESDNTIFSALDDDFEYIFLGGGFGRTLYLLPRPPVIGADSGNQRK